MQFLTEAQCDDWLKQVGRTAPTRQSLLSLPADKHQILEKEPPPRLYHLLQAAIEQLVFDHSDPILLRVFEYGHWESNQHLLLYSLIRRHFLNTGTMVESPGHLAEAHERTFVHAIAFLCVTYGWGFYVISQSGEDALMFEHDGRLGVVPTPSILPF
ncbi:MAG: hypothetical protein ACREJD_16295 [Phycisphaerales bacterium]